MNTKRFEKYSTHRNELSTSTANSTKYIDSTKELKRRSFIENTLKLNTTSIINKSGQINSTTDNIKSTTTTYSNSNSNFNTTTNINNNSTTTTSIGVNFLSSKEVFNHKSLSESELSKIKIIDKYLILVQNLPDSMNSTNVSKQAI